MKYDKEIIKKFGKRDIEYGIFEGNNKILFIKTGQNGTIYGFDNKYLKIAKQINEKIGATVIVASTYFTGKNSLQNGIELIEEYSKERNFIDYDIYYMGFSNGALIGALFANKYEKIKKMLLINMPLFLFLKNIINELNHFKGEEITLVYGDLDQSFKYIPLILPKIHDSIKLEILEDINHYFKDNEEIFINLPEKYLFNNDILKL